MSESSNCENIIQTYPESHGRNSHKLNMMRIEQAFTDSRIKSKELALIRQEEGPHHFEIRQGHYDNNTEAYMSFDASVEELIG